MGKQVVAVLRGVAAGLMFLGLVLSIVGIVTTWWVYEVAAPDGMEGADAGFDFTAWDLHAHLNENTEQASWDSLCEAEPKVEEKKVDTHAFFGGGQQRKETKGNPWCTRLKVARATNILAAIFAFGSLFFIFTGWFNESRNWVKFGSILALLSMLSAISAMIIVIVLSNRFRATSAKPGLGFIFIVLAVVTSLMGMLLACYSSKRGAFEAFVNGTPQAQYGGWGGWRPRRGSFRSAGGLSSPNEGASASPPTSGSPITSQYPSVSPPASCGAPPPQHVPYNQYQPQTIYGQHTPLPRVGMPASGTPQAAQFFDIGSEPGSGASGMPRSHVSEW